MQNSDTSTSATAAAAKASNREDVLAAKLSSKLSSYLLSCDVSLGHAVINIAADKAFEFFKLLKLDSDLAFDLFISVTAVDWMDQRELRFEVVYHLLSTRHLHRLRVKIDLPEQNPVVASVSGLWLGANFMEREVWDMYGVRFEGHPDLRRILMYEEFVGHPLRKDYPVQAKQPRVRMLNPEVRNTAVDMKRSELVQIRGGQKRG